MLSAVFPGLRSFVFALVGAIALAASADAQQPYQETHSSGDMAMAADGRLVAFTMLGLPANQFILFDAADRRATIIETPGPHVGELGWSPDGDELTFVTAEGHTIGGEGRHVWRLRPSAAGPVVELLALIPYVRSPVLSADGARLAAFEGVVAGGGRALGGLNIAYGIFERSLPDGRPTRRSEGHSAIGGALRYDRHGALFVGRMMPVFPRGTHWPPHDANGRWDHQWRADVGGAESFRLLPGEMLPAWPTPFPPGAPRGSLVVPMDDGRVVLYASTRPSSVLDWYDERGQARPRPRPGPMPFDYIAYAEDGAGEILVPTPIPEGAGRTGGADMSSDGAFLAQVINRRGESRGGHTLMVFERGVLAFELPVADLVAQAQRINVPPSDTPLMFAVTEPHRLEIAPTPVPK